MPQDGMAISHSWYNEASGAKESYEYGEEGVVPNRVVFLNNREQ